MDGGVPLHMYARNTFSTAISFIYHEQSFGFLKKRSHFQSLFHKLLNRYHQASWCLSECISLDDSKYTNKIQQICRNLNILEEEK